MYLYMYLMVRMMVKRQRGSDSHEGTTDSQDTTINCGTSFHCNMMDTSQIRFPFFVRQIFLPVEKLFIGVPFFRNLKSIDFWRARTLSEVGLFSLSNGCVNLEELDLGWWYEFCIPEKLQFFIGTCLNKHSLSLTQRCLSRVRYRKVALWH